jgi:hypothetical protein
MLVKGMHADMVGGLCFGLSVCHAVMELQGKESWWEDALQHIYHWDGTSEALDQSIQLRDANDGKSTTLRHIFELAMSYIVHAHATPTEARQAFMARNILQYNALLPSAAAHLEILDDNGQVKTIQQNKRAVGHFNKDQLSALLQEDDLRNRIVLIHSCEHTILISAKGDGVWQLYDANLSHEGAGSMHQSGSKSEITDLIFARLKTQSLAVEAASFDASPAIELAAYEKIFSQSPASLLNEDTLLLFGYESPEKITELFKLAAESRGAQLKSVIAKIMKEAKYGTHDRALHVLVCYAPASIPALLALVDHTPDGMTICSAIAESLNMKRELDGQTPLDTMIMKDLEAVAEFFKLANAGGSIKPIAIALAKALLIKNEYGATSLHTLIQHSPESLPQIWKFVMTSPECKAVRALIEGKGQDSIALRTVMAKALMANNGEHGVVLHAAMREIPKETQDLLKLVLSDHQPENLYAVLQALAGSVDDVTGWQLVTMHMSDAVKAAILQLLSAQLQYLSTPDLIQFGKELSRAVTDEQSVYHGLCSERHKLFSGHYGKTSIWQELIGKSQEILRSRKGAEQQPGAKEVLNIKVGR